MEDLLKKYNSGKLEFVEKPHHVKWTDENDTVPSKHAEDYRERIRRKYGVTALDCNIQTFGSPTSNGQTLSDRVIDNDRAAAKGLKLAYGSTSYQGAKVKVWFEITKDNLAR